MKSKNNNDIKAIAFAGVALFLALLVYSSTFIVNETQQVIVLQLGKAKKIIREPGLNFKIPLVQDLIYYDKRIISIDPPIERVILADKKRLLIDTVTRYKIKDPLLFYKTVGSQSLVATRLGTIVNSSTRDVLGSYTLVNMLDRDRESIIERLTTRVSSEAKYLGLELVDVRIRQADLPKETMQSVFERMRAEREKEAKEFRAQGYQASNEIKSKADRDAAVIISKAKKQAAVLKAKTDTEKYSILRAVMDLDPRFSEFYILMESYQENIKNDNTILVLSTDSPYLKYISKEGR